MAGYIVLRACSHSLVVAITLAAAGCGDRPGAMEAKLFADDHILDVAIELPPADWQALRGQARTSTEVLGNCLREPFADPYTYFHGKVTVDGQVVRDAGVRKKGFLGSNDPDKPSLKLKADEYVHGQRLLGAKTLTLNNSKQDPSLVRTCLAYRVFAAAGVPASRCGFARVSVNGVDLGLYVHVESGSKDFLQLHYDDPDGNLYEGTLSDFRKGWTATFELKTNEEENDRRDLEPVVAALAESDGKLLAALAPVVDLDEVTTFWAVESLLADGDGYSGAANNFYAYHDPTTGRFQLMPWGTDTAFDGLRSPFAPAAPPVILTTGLLARRLYLLPSTHDRIVAELRALLAGVWDETALLAEIDRLAALAGAAADPAAVDEVRAFVLGRRAQVEAELAGAPPKAAALRDAPCYRKAGALAGSFQTSWAQTYAGTASMSGDLDGAAVKGAQGTSLVVSDPDAARSPWIRLTLMAEGQQIVFYLDPARFTAGVDLPLGFTSAWGFVSGPGFSGAFSEGTLHLDAAGLTRGKQVSGSFSGAVVRAARAEEDDD